MAEQSTAEQTRDAEQSAEADAQSEALVTTREKDQVAVPRLIELRQQPIQEELPLAIVQGEPVVKVPDDLYIPPAALEVFLEAFEGPLDLLLYLICLLYTSDAADDP